MSQNMEVQESFSLKQYACFFTGGTFGTAWRRSPSTSIGPVIGLLNRRLDGSAWALRETCSACCARFPMGKRCSILCVDFPNPYGADFRTAPAAYARISVIGQRSVPIEEFCPHCACKTHVSDGAYSQAGEKRIQITAHGGGEAAKLRATDQKRDHCDDQKGPERVA